MSRRLDPREANHSIIVVRIGRLPAIPATACASMSVAPVYFKVPAFANSIIKNISVHQSTSFSMYSLAFVLFHNMTILAPIKDAAKRSVLWGRSNIDSIRLCIAISAIVDKNIATPILNSFLSGTNSHSS
ncbi:MAG: hypothetical protein AMQ22_02200 [Candidatus Methanofastidiosum methylothiophilum]|uniref:Uncharacterized protein n=1 Tax=Candidatus Methanofastidiosum methylothiophilum TaxID=1705564 RepID=A0A150IKS0_9EURY|nr:MAG: hypothetical protein AMQ22_02200 [Candidatus Methanofastidiosum methylthiophilus]